MALIAIQSVSTGTLRSGCSHIWRVALCEREGCSSYRKGGRELEEALPPPVFLSWKRDKACTALPVTRGYEP